MDPPGNPRLRGPDGSRTGHPKPASDVTYDTMIEINLSTHCRQFRRNLEHYDAGKAFSTIGPRRREDFLAQLQTLADAAGSVADSGAPTGPTDAEYFTDSSTI